MHFRQIQQPVEDERTLARELRRMKWSEAQISNAKLEVTSMRANWLNAGARYFTNAAHLVMIADAQRLLHAPRDFEPMWWMRVYRHDGKRLRDHWRTLQTIKNELIGPEHEAVEVYPPESRLHDGENSYHLFAFQNPGPRLPFGLAGLRNAGADGGATLPTRFVADRAAA